MRRSDVPRALVLESFRGCNMRCPHCNVPWIGHSLTQPTGMMSREVFASLRSLLPFVSVVGYDSMGEPTLNPYLPEFIHQQKTEAPTSIARLTSNLLAVRRQQLEQLLNAGLDELQVSIDAASESIFQAHRIGCTLHHTVEMISVVRQVAEEIGYQAFRMICCFVAKADNIFELPEVARLISKLGVNALYVNGLEPYSSADFSRALWASEEGRSVAHRVFSETRSLNEKEDLRLEIEFPNLEPRSSGCKFPIETMTVNYDGSVSPCFVGGMATTVWTEQGDPVKRSPVVFGNTFDSDPLDIWLNPEYVKFRLAAQQGGSAQPQICEACLRGCGVICTSATSPSWGEGA